jgi:integrase
MRDAVSRPLRRHAGIILSPHLYRHIIAKIVAERSPQNLHDVSRMLGHKSMSTTYGSYLGTEGPAASRRIAALLREVSGRKSGEQE